MKNRKFQNQGLAAHTSTWMGLCTISICTITFCALTAGQSMAQSTWSGAAGVTWNNAGNWDTIPVDNGALIFSGSPANQPSNNDFPALITGDISFTNAGPAGTAPNNVTSAFTLGGTVITLGGNIATSAVQATASGGIDITDILGMNVILNGTRTINTARQGGTGGNRLSHNLEISGQITESGGSFGLTKSGDANLTLSNATNSFTGTLQINGAGAVIATSLEPSGVPSSIGSGSAINFTNNSGTLRFVGSVAPGAAINRSINFSSTGAAGGSIDNSSASVPLTFNGVFTNTGGGAKSFTLTGTNTGANVLSSILVNGDTGGVLGLSKSGLGAWTVSGNSTFTGNVLIDNGTLRASSIADTGTSSLGLGNLVQIGNSSRSSVLDYTGTGSTTGRQVKIGGFVGTAGSGNATILASATSGTSTGLKFTATNFNSAETITTTPLTRVLTLGGDNADANEITGAIADGNASVLTSLNKTGAGLWIFSGQNSYTGNSVNVGGGITGSTVITGGILQVNQATNGLGNSTATNAVTLNGGTLSLRNDGTGSNGAITYGSTSNPSGYNVQLSASSTVNVANLTANTGNTIQLGPITQVAVGNRTLNVTGANGYSLTLTSLGLCPLTGLTTTLNPTTASLIITGNVINPMSGFGAGNFNTLTLGGTSPGNRIQGIVSDAAGSSDVLGGLTRITKTGSSTWELNGNNTNDGIMSVNEGTLFINGDSSGATGVVTVSGGDLGGTGTIGGLVNVTANGSLAPGANAVGTLTCAGLSLGVMADEGGTGTLKFELGPIASSDKIVVTGGLALGGGGLGVSDFSFTALAGLTNGTYPLITGATSVTGTLNAANTTGPIGGGKQGALQLSGNDLVMVVSDAAADPYLTWTGNNPGILFDGDENNDGIENGLAWLLGAAGPTSSVTRPTVTQNGSGLVISFNMLNAAGRGTSIVQIEHSSDLGISDPWTAVTVPDANGGPTSGVTFAVTAGSPTNGVVATISNSEAASGNLFGRLKGIK